MHQLTHGIVLFGKSFSKTDAKDASPPTNALNISRFSTSITTECRNDSEQLVLLDGVPAPSSTFDALGKDVRATGTSRQESFLAKLVLQSRHV